MTRAAAGHLHPPAPALLTAALLVLLAAGGPTAAATKGPASPAPPAPLTNEDIVRLVVNGTAEAVILREIVARPPAFDLDPGVVVELERVGVGRTIIDAMRRRQGEVAPKVPPPKPETRPAEPPAAAPPAGRLEIAFSPGPDGKPADVFAIATLPKNVVPPKDSEIGTVSELALAVLCTTTDHVPDHWDTLSPIEGGPRHEVVLFRPGDHSTRDRGFELLSLDRTPVGPIPLPAGRHALVVALAGKQSGSGVWRLLASASVRVDSAPDRANRLLLDARSRLLGSRMTGYRVEQVWTVREEGPEGPGGGPPAGGAPAAGPPRGSRR